MKQVNYLIVEDEAITAEMLRLLITKVRPDYKNCSITSSVKETVELLRHSLSTPDLIFMDIELSDAICFEIFRKVKTDIPVIFTTAYHEHALQAFKINSIDYILKPVKELELRTAIEKFESLRATRHILPDYSKIEEILTRQNTRNRILVSRGNSYIHIDCVEIASVSSEEKLTWITTFSGRKYIIDYTLDQLDGELSREIFYRISRSHIINIRSISKVDKYFHGRLRVTINSSPPLEIIVSAARRDGFLMWLDGNLR